MLSFQNISLRQGSRLLFEHFSLAIHPGQRVGLIGANGCGKSSLFKLILGQLQSDQGEIKRPTHWVLAHVSQETPAVDIPALEYVLDGDTELRFLQSELLSAEQQNDGTRQGNLHGRIAAIGGYAAPTRAAKLMHGLGFTTAQETQPVNTFSGGWRMRLNLAQALMCRSDLLLLDEPTNHLDLEAVLWLEDWLNHYPGTLLLISHDRELLDRTVHYIAQIENGNIGYYRGNYADFERQRSEQHAQQQASYQKQQLEIAHIQRFIDRFRAKATKARQAQSRLKALEQMERVAPIHIDSPFRFSLLQPDKLPISLLRLNQVAIGYGQQNILTQINLNLAPRDRIGLLGPNGSGKSTLVKLLAGVLSARSGTLDRAPDLRIGYFAQHQIEQLYFHESPLQHLQRLAPKAAEKDLRNFLGGFNFQGDQALTPTELFSGGEKARLALALLIYQRPNLLLLDEPTNHLDLEMRYALTTALQDFEGAMVMVSHDRHLLRSTVDILWLVAESTALLFNGDLDDYQQWLSKRRSTEEGYSENVSTNTRKDRRRQEAERRQTLQPLQKKLKEIETTLEKLAAEKLNLNQTLINPDLYQDPTQKEYLKTLLMKQAHLEQNLRETEEHWLIASEALEVATQGD
ncbi:glutathione ABC transporter ATP-binding protein [Candidatus Nitrosoglobus terrae]|uniref:Probable ATP-binding protein YheS n=1 Tax=Candidatus Nitrosoglobus terrae TaxID=1630141 RepID=A0A1Q2SM05_9GAMM|nr:ATP-binding cassette domain-containing protein [Candidatus Nitrosoglobus terrae]BAW80143.1 glutathione ABC transporter ATP-binding protein [Candidatus Nitrosoglobus terrae]